MSKFRLTKRQRLRIQKSQQSVGLRVGRENTGDVLDTNESNQRHLGWEQSGLVIAHYGTQVEVASLDDAMQPVTTRRCHFRSHLGSLVAGDRVVWRDGEPNGLIVAVTPRKTELCRPDPYGDLKAVAANVDRLLVIIAPAPAPQSQLIDRYIVAAEAAGIQPVVVLNKRDLLTADNAAQLRALLAMYRSIGYLTVETSANTQNGLAPLRQILAQGTSVFVGQSGVGKSSLVNALAPSVNTPVGALSNGGQKGSHTTTTARFFHLAESGSVIDSPGIRKFGLWHMSEQMILYGFVELRPWIGRCKFRDCQHLQEPGCRIRRAAAEDSICAMRMQSFEYLRDSLHGNNKARNTELREDKR